MSADNSWPGRVEIMPPLTWAECKRSPAVEDVKLDIREQDGPDGRILTAVAVLPARSSDSWSAHAERELREAGRIPEGAEPYDNQIQFRTGDDEIVISYELEAHES